jgi:hypothetical protein
MTTSAFPLDLRISPAAAAAWWQRSDTYVLAAVAAIQAASVGPVMWEMTNGKWSVGGASGIDEALIGIVVGQCFLLGVWAALGGLRTIVRWSLIGGLFLLGVASIVVCFRADEDIASQCLMAGLIGALFVTGFAAAILPLRGLAGWRVDFDLVHYAHIRRLRGQASFVDFAAMSCAIALPLTIARLGAESEGEPSASEWLTILGVMAVIAASAAPICYAVLAWRRLPWALLAAAGWSLAIGLAHGLLSLWTTQLNIVGSNTTWTGAVFSSTVFHAAIAVTCGGTLAALRLCGLKLLVVAHSTAHAPREGSSSPSEMPTIFTPRKAA